MSDLRPLVIGTGAVGIALGSAFIAAGQRPRLLARKGTADALRRHGLRRQGLLGERSDPPGSFDLRLDADDFPDPPAGVALVCTKSFDTAAVARALADAPGALAPDAPIVLCQNGWGHLERFTPYFAPERLFAASLMTGFRRPAPHVSEITVHARSILMGSLEGRSPRPLQPTANAITAGGIPCALTDEMEAVAWAKILYNSCLNPLGAVLGRPYGALAEDPETRRTMDALARETFAVLAAAGIRTHWSDAEAWLDHFYTELVPPTASHESSMLQDLRAGRRTEIDSLTGAIIGLAEVHGVAVPTHRELRDRISASESNAPRRR